MYSLLNFLHNIKGFLVSIRMGYADDLLLRLCDIIAEKRSRYIETYDKLPPIKIS